MAYQPYLISKFATGLDKSVQPWLIPDEAQDTLYDGFIYRGEWSKRPGYNPFATGLAGAYVESRMIGTVSAVAPTTGSINGSNTAFTWAAASFPLARNGFTIVGSNPAVTLTDNGIGDILYAKKTITAATKANPCVLTVTSHGYSNGDQVYISGVNGMTQLNSPFLYTIGSVTTNTFALVGVDSTNFTTYTTPDGSVQKYAGTINYTTGAVSITLATAPVSMSTLLATYTYHPGLPVMMVANYYGVNSGQELRQLVVADEVHVNLYDPATNSLKDITPNPVLSGQNFNFFSWTNYADSLDNQRLLFVNNVNPIQSFNGTSVSAISFYTASTIVTSESYGTADGTKGPFTHTASHIPLLPGSVSVTSDAQTVSDNGFGVFTGNGTGTVNYSTGAMSVTFAANTTNTDAITVNYTYMITPITTALHLFNLRDRLIILQPTYGGTKFPRRIMISGTGAYSDIFSLDALGAGFIDVPDASWITAATFNRDDLLIFTGSSTWILKYTGNDANPFVLDKLDSSRGSGAPYSAITYLNRSTTLSQRGLIVSDGYKVDRSDDKIPRFSFEDINQSYFNLITVGSVDADRDHYLIYPSINSSTSDSILVTNYEEDNYAIYRLPLSCMGPFLDDSGATWNSLTQAAGYWNWQVTANKFPTWHAFAFSNGQPIGIGGGQHGEIWELNINNTEDDLVRIRGATVIDSDTLELTTDFQSWAIGDYVFITGMTGMEEGNNKQGAIASIPTQNSVIRITMPTERFSAYSTGGSCMRVIPFESSTKKFNPFIEQAQKVRVGYMYFYMNTSNVLTTRNSNIDSIQNTFPATVTSYEHGFNTGDNITIYGVSGMTQINGLSSNITVTDSETFLMDTIDATAFSAYSSGGVAVGPENALLQVKVTVNDNDSYTKLEDSSAVAYVAPYLVDFTVDSSMATKNWIKIYINQIGKFIQFTMSNTQAGSNVRIQAVMPGLDNVGRLI